MFVRAERRTGKTSRRNRSQESITFTVVENKRVDEKVKQRRVLYLGTFNETLLEKWNDGGISPERIWGVISKKLYASDLPEADINHVLFNLTRWLRPVTTEDILKSVKVQATTMGIDPDELMDKRMQEPLWRVAEALSNICSQPKVSPPLDICKHDAHPSRNEPGPD